MKTLTLCLPLFYLLGTSLAAQSVELDAIGVEASHADEVLVERKVQTTQTLAKDAKGETLGDYLEQEQFVDSASYGPAVGRPVVKGMDGYRVGITQGNTLLNDLSAMSQDHAVGVMARASQKIEFLKGPSSLLYGNFSGGVIRVLGEEHQNTLPKESFGADLTLQSGTNGSGDLASGTLQVRQGDFALSISSHFHEADPYDDARGNRVKDSDTLSRQNHLVLGYRHNENNTLKLFADTMQKEYGIANTTNRRTSIDMEQERYGLVWHLKNLDTLEYMQTEFSYSDYLHKEMEGSSADGLFGQEQFALSTLFGFDMGAWHSDASIGYTNSSLEVCHEHGRCYSFYDAPRNPNQADGESLQESLDVKGLPYSHGHPMPNTTEQNLKLGLSLKNFYDDANEFSLALRTELRKLKIDSVNIQQEWLVPSSVDLNYYDTIDDSAISLSTGWFSYLSDSLSLQSSLSYIERLPAASELFWNGFHHATNTYIFGDRTLDNERSYNFDLELMHNAEKLTSQLALFYYHFENYIYQTPLSDAQGDLLIDPFHLSNVWGMQGVAAKVYGLALKESYQLHYKEHRFTPSLTLEMIRGALKEGGAIPRMPPFSATFALAYNYADFDAALTFKRMDKSRYEAQNESATPGYNWLSLSMHYGYKTSYADLQFFLKGENLTDAQAYNHLSFLKESAPLPGRQLKAGLRIKF